jgi:protein-S-isoprenylcysteine O-methyltransferase Ste14
MTNARDNAGVITRPPILYLGALVIFLGLRWLWPAPIVGGHGTAMIVVGAVFGALAIALAIWGRNTLVAGGTNVDPMQPSTAIVSGGPYRFTRNPLYVSMTLLYLGFTLAFDTWWGLVVLVPLLAVMHLGVVRREERYLEAKFGDTYLRYKASVPRYLGRSSVEAAVR